MSNYLALQGNNIGAGILLNVVVVSLVRVFTNFKPNRDRGGRLHRGTVSVSISIASAG